MKSNKFFPKILLTLVVIASVVFNPTQVGNAQTDQEWSEPVNLSLSGIATNPIVVVDRENVIHAIWLDEVDGYKYSQSVDGKTWLPARTVQFPFEARDQQPVILADELGSIHFFWINRFRDLYYGQAVPVNFAQPGDWRVTARLAVDVLNFHAIVDDGGFLHLAYVGTGVTGGIPAGIYYRKSNIGGSAWPDIDNVYQSEYYRGANPDDAYVRVSTSESQSEQKVFITWDNRAQKRVLMAVSDDSGRTWNSAREIKGPADTGGIDTPFNLTVSARGENVLLIWQVGEPGSSKCTVFSQWSLDGGVSWENAVPVLGGRSECPIGTNIVAKNEQYTVVTFGGQVNPIMVAWNGVEWSDPQPQTQLPSFINPDTFDAILLGCRFDLIYRDRLYVAGCDQGRGGDVWFLSRALAPVETWFSPSFTWSEPETLLIKSEDPERITNFHTAHDSIGNIHAVWAQSPAAQANTTDFTIKYARWDGARWTTPESVSSSFVGMPLQASMTVDSLDRVLLSWIDGFNGDLIFSWANLEKANIASEWQAATGLPVASRLINESDVVVDGSGRIVIAYVIPTNENRGIFMTQSTDGGKNWTEPVLVFDAVAAEWERIEKPRLSLGGDGVLHLAFVRSTVRDGQPVGMYYLHSTDGGTTWSGSQILSEGAVEWLDIVSYDDATVHVIWQEFDGLVFANVSQVSTDSGATWSKQYNVTGVYENPTKIALASDGRGLLHFIQLVENNNGDTYNQISLILQDWKWDGAAWVPELAKDFVVKGQEVAYSLSAGITTSGFLGVFVPVEYSDTNEQFISEILTFKRSLEFDENLEPILVPVLPTGIVEAVDGVTVVVQPTPTPNFSILYDDNVATSPFQQNIAGLILIGVGVVATIFLVLWRRPAKKEK